MSTPILRETDSKSRLTLPRQFANATLILDVVSDVEIIIRKAKITLLEPGEQPEDLPRLKPLSERDWEFLHETLESPAPEPTESFRKAMAAASTAKSA
ncbi:MAG: hypothetical protein ACRCZF_16725, partial [Gemmataceae bacterium]